MVVDPISVNVGIAVVSAAAGAATQFPKIQELERELEIAKLALTEVRTTRYEVLLYYAVWVPTDGRCHVYCHVFMMVKSGKRI